VSDPKRLLAPGSKSTGAMRELLRAARSDLPDEGRVEAIALRIGPLMGAPHGGHGPGGPAGPPSAGPPPSAPPAGALGGAGAAATGLKLATAAKVAAVLATLGTAGGAGVYAGVAYHRDPIAPVNPIAVMAAPARPATIPGLHPSAPPAVDAVVVAEPALAPAPSVVDAVVATSPTPAPAPPAIVAGPPAPAPAPPAIDAVVAFNPVAPVRPAAPTPRGVEGGDTEIAILEAAQDRLASNPAAALAYAERHAARFPGGVLAQEREVIAIESLVRLHRDAEARQRAERFYRDFPSSAHRARIEALVDEGG
jgi:hypothetical protein